MLHFGHMNGSSQTRSTHINEIEAKYSRFLDLSLRLSLMEIQDVLKRVSPDLQIRETAKDWSPKEEQFLRYVSTQIHKIVKEISKIHKIGIEIYWSWLFKFLNECDQV